MKDKIKDISQKTEDEIIKSIQELVRIPSVRNLDDSAKGAPFGKDIGRALDTVLEKAKSFGMRTFRDEEGYYGYIEVGPENSKDMIGIIGHLDVVPAGDEEQWTIGKPFSGDVVDGKIIGRGTLDDKGPVAICLHALKNLMDLEVKFTKRVRIILGTAEETTWECINKYTELEEHPTIAFSPDADFPLINAEKTISQFEAHAKNDVDFTITSLGAYNAVADSAIYTGQNIDKLKTELDKLGYDYKVLSDNELNVLGKSSHAMATQLGVNAISRLCIALYNIDIHSKAIDFIATKVKETYGAELIQGEVKDEISGELKFNVGRLEIKDGKEIIGMDTRIPVLVDPNKILKVYEETLSEFGFEYKELKTQAKLYVEEDSFLVSTLMSVYKDITGEQDAKPLSSGGGTYARAFDNCVAFGCVFNSMNMINNMHQPNECFELKYLPLAIEIYTNAINELLK